VGGGGCGGETSEDEEGAIAVGCDRRETLIYFENFFN
jgi:hypothetical protein